MGQYRSGALAAGNDLAASRYFRETIRITVAADVANAYFRLRAADALLLIFEETRKTRLDTVSLQRDRFDAGIIGEYDLRQAEAELEAVIADIERARRAIGLTEALATDRPFAARGVYAGVARGAASMPRRAYRSCRRGHRAWWHGAPISGARVGLAASDCAFSRHAPTIF